MEWLEQVIAAINAPITKTVWLFAAGIILKRWPEFYNKWIPAALALLSGLATLFAALAGLLGAGPQPDAVPGLYVPAVLQVDGQPIWLNFILSWLVPVLVAIGTQSSVKNTREGITEKKKGVVK